MSPVACLDDPVGLQHYPICVGAKRAREEALSVAIGQASVVVRRFFAVLGREVLAGLGGAVDLTFMTKDYFCQLRPDLIGRMREHILRRVKKFSNRIGGIFFRDWCYFWHAAALSGTKSCNTRAGSQGRARFLDQF